jgi:hypothetical protein
MHTLKKKKETGLHFLEIVSEIDIRKGLFMILDAD